MTLIVNKLLMEIESKLLKDKIPENNKNAIRNYHLKFEIRWG